MDTRTSELFHCNCCGEEKDGQPMQDVDLGPVCVDCSRHIRNGMAWLRHCVGAVRPLKKSDVNDNNYKRFMP